MLELRRDDLQIFLIHYSFFVSILYWYIYNKGNIEFKIDSKLTPKLTPNSTPKKTPDSTPYFTTFPNFISFSVCQILTCINFLKITYIPIILRKIHISGNREEKLFKD